MQAGFFRCEGGNLSHQSSFSSPFSPMHASPAYISNTYLPTYLLLYLPPYYLPTYQPINLPTYQPTLQPRPIISRQRGGLHPELGAGRGPARRRRRARRRRARAHARDPSASTSTSPSTAIRRRWNGGGDKRVGRRERGGEGSLFTG